MNRILTFGVFDYFHLGHLRLFKQCKYYGDYILKYKPETKVLYSTEERLEILNELKIVDEVIVYDTVSISTLEKIDFDILALGDDHKGQRFDEVEQWCNVNSKRVVRLKRTPGISSSLLKDKLEVLE